MPFSVKAAYACIAMLELAASHGQARPVRVKSIAEAHGLKVRFLTQIVMELRVAGLVTSTRGTRGGYWLALPPDQISLADVIRVADSRTQSQTPPAAWTASPAGQAIFLIWQEAQALEQRLLEATTLAELVRRYQRGDPTTYQI